VGGRRGRGREMGWKMGGEGGVRAWREKYATRARGIDAPGFIFAMCQTIDANLNNSAYSRGKTVMRLFRAPPSGWRQF